MSEKRKDVMNILETLKQKLLQGRRITEDVLHIRNESLDAFLEALERPQERIKNLTAEQKRDTIENILILKTFREVHPA